MNEITPSDSNSQTNNSIRGPIALARDAYDFFTKNAPLLMGIYIAPAVLAVAYGIFASLLLSDDHDLLLQLVSIPFVALGTILLILISIVSAIALIQAVSAPQGMTVASTYRLGLKHFLAYIWLSILVGLTVGVGFLLFIIPGIIFMVWFAFSYYILIFEGKKGIEAMKASKAYVKGRWGAIFGRFLVLVVGVLVVTGIVNFILSLFLPFSKETIEAVASISNVVLVPFSIAYMYFLYLDVKKDDVTTSEEAPVIQP